MRYRGWLMVAFVLFSAGDGWAQAGQHGGKAIPGATSVPAVPQQTTATFGNWTLRCARPAGAAKSCELVQVAQRDGKPVAEMAIGSVTKGQKLQFTILVPTSVSFGMSPTLAPASGEGVGLTLNWRRCLPVGCIADGEIGDDALSRLRGWSQPARVVFADGGGRSVEVAVSPVGLAPALDALAKEDAS